MDINFPAYFLGGGGGVLMQYLNESKFAKRS